MVTTSKERNENIEVARHPEYSNNKVTPLSEVVKYECVDTTAVLLAHTKKSTDALEYISDNCAVGWGKMVEKVMEKLKHIMSLITQKITKKQDQLLSIDSLINYLESPSPDSSIDEVSNASQLESGLRGVGIIS